MGTIAEVTFLRHGFIGRRHLDSGINIAVQMQAVQCFVVERKSFASRFEEVRVCLRIIFDTSLGDRRFRWMRVCVRA